MCADCGCFAVASFKSGWDYYPMSRVNGGKLQSGSMTFIECCDACDADSDCQAIDWDVDKHQEGFNSCWL